MHFDTPQALVPLAAPTPLRLTDARGTRVRAVAGTLWLTIDGDLRDLVLQAGQSLVIDTPRRVLVTTLGGPATAGVCAARRAPPAWLGRLAQRLRPAGGLAALLAA